MEDRLCDGLYLEMTDLDPVLYAEERVPVTATIEGVRRGTWWENACPDRHDLPRVLPEFGVLGLYEVDAGFRAPRAADGIRGLHYRRYPRPAQGLLSGNPTLGLSLVLISPKRPEQAGELRDWADFVHIRHIAETANPGYTMITSFENAEGLDPRFLHLYEMDTDDPETAFKAMAPRVAKSLGAGPGDPAYDRWAWHPALRIMYVNSFRRLGTTGWS